VIDIVTSILNSANDCAGAPSDCENDLNRAICLSTPHTCGECKPGYVGISGDSNTRCRNGTTISTISTSTSNNFNRDNRKLVATSTDEYNAAYSTCVSDDQCGWGYCSNNNICLPYLKTCPSSTHGTICSGQGECIYLETSGAPVSECLSSNVNCYAFCACIEGYAGSSCTSSATLFNATESIRNQLCAALENSTSLHDKSSDLLETASASLVSIVNPAEIYSQSTIETCFKVLNQLKDVALEGYVVGTTDSMTQLVSTTSQLIEIMKLKRAYSLLQKYNGTASSNRVVGKSKI